jgi:hypothetical protein
MLDAVKEPKVCLLVWAGMAQYIPLIYRAGVILNKKYK